MDNKKYIILEIIPTALDPDKGDIVQLSALKLDGIKLLDRFDYRLNKDKVNNKYLLELTDYDNDKFDYLDNSLDIIDKFKEFIEDYDLLFIDNQYTLDYLKYFDNNKESIVNYLDMEYSTDLIDKIITKYHLKPSNYIVDLLYEALIYHYKWYIFLVKILQYKKNI